MLKEAFHFDHVDAETTGAPPRIKTVAEGLQFLSKEFGLCIDEIEKLHREKKISTEFAEKLMLRYKKDIMVARKFVAGIFRIARKEDKIFMNVKRPESLLLKMKKKNFENIFDILRATIATHNQKETEQKIESSKVFRIAEKEKKMPSAENPYFGPTHYLLSIGNSVLELKAMTPQSWNMQNRSHASYKGAQAGTVNPAESNRKTYGMYKYASLQQEKFDKRKKPEVRERPETYVP